MLFLPVFVLVSSSVIMSLLNLCILVYFFFIFFFFFKQKTAYEMPISDWSPDVCSSDLCPTHSPPPRPARPTPDASAHEPGSAGPPLPVHRWHPVAGGLGRDGGAEPFRHGHRPGQRRRPDQRRAAGLLGERQADFRRRRHGDRPLPAAALPSDLAGDPRHHHLVDDPHPRDLRPRRGLACEP